MVVNEYIEIKGARVNNLKNISINIPRNQLIVIAGLSGSGKLSLASDILYVEGQRRYVESLSSYARQLSGHMSKPECDFIKGLPPAIAIEQKVISRNPRSIVGTPTEIYEYLRLLFVRIGKIYSPTSGGEVKKHSTDDIANRTQQYSKGIKFAILAPLHLIEGRTLEKQPEMGIQESYTRLWLKNDFVRIDNFLADKETLGKAKVDETPLLVDRLSIDGAKGVISRLIDPAEIALYEGRGECRLVLFSPDITYESSMRYEVDGMTFEEPNDNMFSFNSPLGVCPTCEGFSSIIGIDGRLVTPNSTPSVYDDCA